MPTARELLEQADALMRRNRNGAPADAAPADKLPGTIGGAAVPPGMTSPRTIQREPIAPSAARISLPVDPSESPAFAAAAAVPPTPYVPRAGETLAELRARIERAETPPDDPPAVVAEAGDADDVPLLTDVVEEIDVGIVDESAQGEPSLWDIASRGEASVLGTNPASIARPPDAAAVPRTPPPGRDPLGLDQPPPGFALPAGPTEAADERAEAMSAPAEPESAAVTAASAVDDAGEPVVVSDEWGPVDEASLPSAEPSQAAAAFASAAVDAAMPAQAVPASPTPSAEDIARIREIAEEIGMQVLQRIDIYSDTTLPAQLGERLKPVVERASADLVAAINQHVGELLRACIAEAISREIETWRGGGR